MRCGPDLLLQVADVRMLTPRTSAYRLIAPGGGDLPAWQAGARSLNPGCAPPVATPIPVGACSCACAGLGLCCC